MQRFRGNRDKLQQAMVNLIENAIKYALPNGSVEIGASLEKKFLRFWVKDTEVGIPEADFERVFEKFQQLNNYPDHRERGYGLGLSITSEIVTAAGGKFEAESHVGDGSAFYVTIPV